MAIKSFQIEPIKMYTEMLKSYGKSQETPIATFHEFVEEIPLDYRGLVFDATVKDTVGRSVSEPTWGRLYSFDRGRLLYIGEALHKRHDYDDYGPYHSSYSEQTGSILYSTMLDEVVVPNIEIVEGISPNEPSLVSHKFLNTTTEELINFEMLAYKKFDRSVFQKQMHGIMSIEDILDCVRLEVGEGEQFEGLTTNILETIILDSIANNTDRHVRNWGLIRNKDTGEYKLAVYDHTSVFLNMSYEYGRFRDNNWMPSHIINLPAAQIVKPSFGQDGSKLVRHIATNYPQHLSAFMEKFDDRIEDVYEKFAGFPKELSLSRLKGKIGEKQRYIKNIVERGDDEYAG